MEKQILKWIENGLITQEKADELLADWNLEKDKKRKINSQRALYATGAVLIGLGLISFVAANNWILNLIIFLKVFLLAALTISSLVGGYKMVYENKKYPRLGNALIFLSTLFLGSTYFMIAQQYHLSAHNSMLMFLWLVSIYPLAFLFKLRSINLLSIFIFILGTVFYYMELSYDSGQIWTVYIPVMLGVFLYTLGNVPIIQEKYNGFSLSYKIVGLVSIFITLLILTYNVEDSYRLISLNYWFPIAILGILNLLNIYFQKEKSVLFKLEELFLFILLGLLLLILNMPHIDIVRAKTVAHVLLIFIIFTGFNFGFKFENLKLVNLSTKFLIIYIISIYLRFCWSYLDKSFFFIAGGILLFGLGLFLERKKNELIKRNKNENE